MCNYFDNKIKPKVLEESYNKTYDLEEQVIKTSTYVNGFAHDPMPIIADEVLEEFIIGSWGISAPWIKEDDKKAILPLNARLDTIDSKPTFKNNVKNRCVIPVNAFLEWQRRDKDGNVDPEGKVKVKHRIFTNDDSIFGLGGIYYIDKNQKLTFAVVTTDANKLMTFIHNGGDNPHRMPIILPVGMENEWLNNSNPLQDFEFPNYDPKLDFEVVE